MKYKNSDILKFSDGYWITTIQGQRIIKLIGSFKTLNEAKTEIKQLNLLN